MGLSCKQIYGDGLNWSQSLLQNPVLEIPVLREQPKAQGKRQQQHRQQEALRCPRCDSTNTKFCYYNNYNQSQPRHFCKTCKRHWTKGGTLRNVPVGGGRKNKRLKRTTLTEDEHIPHDTTTIDQQFLPTLTDQNNTISGILYNSNPLLRPPNCPNNTTDNNTNMSANEFMDSAPISPLLSLPGFHFQKPTNPYEDSSFNMLPDPFCENRKQNQLLFPLASAENGPSDNHVESMPWQLSATSFADTVPATSFWNTGDIWALLSNIGVGSDVQQEETDIVEGEELV